MIILLYSGGNVDKLPTIQYLDIKINTNTIYCKNFSTKPVQNHV